MNKWPNLLTDSKSIDRIYGNETPSLTSVDLHELIFHRDGPRISLRFDLPDYPTNPPKKWLSNGFNTTQLCLELLDVHFSELSGWTKTSYISDIDLSKEENHVKIEIKSDSFTMSAKAKFAYISNISGYLKE